MEKSELFAAYEGTLFGIVNKVLLTGVFSEPEEPIRKGERVIDEMSPLQRAIWTAFKQAEKELKMGRTHDELCVTSGKVNGLKNLFWSSIQIAFGSAVFEGGGIDIRKGFKIVQLPEENSYDTRIMLSIMKGLHNLPSADHDCATCDMYDDCGFPFKKPRA